MSKNLVTLFFGAFLLAFCTLGLEWLRAGCDQENCKGTTVAGGSRGCVDFAAFSVTANACVHKDHIDGGWGGYRFNCRKSNPQIEVVNCVDCRCGYQQGASHGAACRCRHKDVTTNIHAGTLQAGNSSTDDD